MKLTWHGTASLTIASESTRILVDPFLPMAGSTVPITTADFSGTETILLTHAHFDHIYSIPLLCRREPRILYGTRASALALRELGAPAGCFRMVRPGSSFTVEDLHITVYQSKHIRFDRKLIRETLASSRLLEHRGNLLPLLHRNLQCQQHGEIVGYHITDHESSVFVLGSLNLDPDTVYPTDMDVLVLPYQGRSDLVTPALEVITRLQPKAVFLDHFDDTFPPMSKTVDPSDLLQAAEDRLPIHVPAYGVPYTVE